MFYRMNKYALYAMTLLLTLSGCQVEDLRKLIDFSERGSNKPCIVGVWPTVKAGNTKYKMSPARANKFVADVRAAAKLSNKYRYKKAAGGKKIPRLCKKLLWHKGKKLPSAYLKCMTDWGNNTVKKYKSCSQKLVIGSAVISSEGKAKILIVNLKKPGKYANRKNVYATGKDLNRLARNIGRKIRKIVR